MKLFIFDIENACSYTMSAMCSLGAVEFDEKFTVITSENILVNPRRKIKMKHVNLGLTDAQLKKAPTFFELYPRIKRLIESADYVLGYSVANDFNMLNAAIRKAELPPINAQKVVCVQKLYSVYSKERRQVSLGEAAEKIGFSFVQHNSQADAEATLAILQHVCREEGATFSALLEKYGVSPGACVGFKYREAEVRAYYDLKVKKSACRYIGELAAGITVNRKALSKDFVFYNKRVMFDSEFMERKDLFDIVESVLLRGGRYTNSNVNADYFICDNPDSNKLKHLLRYDKRGYVRVITLAEFLEMAGI